MKKVTLVYCSFFLLFPSILWAQVQCVLPVASAKSGAITAVASDWEAIGINPANLGWDNNDKVSFSILNIGLAGQSGGLSLNNIKTIMRSGDTNQPAASRQILGAKNGTSLFADINWFSFSLKLDKIGAFAVSLSDKAMVNFALSPGGTKLLTQKGYLSDSTILNGLNGGSSLTLYQYRELNVDFGRELFEFGGQKASGNGDYYQGYNVRYLNYMGEGAKKDSAPKAGDDAFRIYGGIGLKYLWGQTYFNGDIVNSGINAYYAVPVNFPGVAPFGANAGHGLGADLGLSGTYKKWTFGVSATDLGSITWHRSSFSLSDTAIFGLNSFTKVFNKLDSNNVTDFKRTSNVNMILASKLRFGAAYQITTHITLSSDIIFPLNNAIGNLVGPYFAFGSQIGVGKVLILNLGFATTTDYGVSVPLGLSLCAGHAVQMYFGTSDVLTYFGKTNNGNISVAYGLIRINILGKKS